MSKIPYTGKSQQAQQARQGQQVTQNVPVDPLAPAENLAPENPLLEDPDAPRVMQGVFPDELHPMTDDDRRWLMKNKMPVE